MIRRILHAIGVGAGAFIRDLFPEQVEAFTTSARDASFASRWASCTAPVTNVRGVCSRCGSKIGPRDTAWGPPMFAGKGDLLCDYCHQVTKGGA